MKYNFQVLSELNVQNIDTIILSFPERFYDISYINKEILLPLWSIIEAKLEKKIINNAGVSDFNKNFLEQLCNLIENKNYLPTLNQVNLNSCCKMPDDLLEFAKINNIQLTTHSDSRGNKKNSSCISRSYFYINQKHECYNFVNIIIYIYNYLATVTN